MKFSQKAKYIGYGIVGTALLTPLALKAIDTIPISFSEGDVISAGVMNAILGRVNQVQNGFTNVTELDGNWSCTTYETLPVVDYCTVVTDSPFLYQKIGTMNFTASNKTWSYTGTGTPYFCGQGGPKSGAYDVKSNRLILQGEAWDNPGVFFTYVFRLTKKGATNFVWDAGSNGNDAFIECSKNSIPPAPANNLTASVAGTSVSLTWTDQSIDETGFKVQRKTSVSGTWSNVTTTAANATSYSDNSLATGTYWYRVLATNSNGDSISSSEVQVIIP